MKTNNFEQVKKYLVPVFSIIAVFVMIPVFIMPQLTRISDASKIINKNQKRLDAIEKKALDLEKLSKQKDSLDKKIEIIEQALPVDKSVAPLVSGIQQLAITSGLVVGSFKIVPGKTATEAAKPVSNTQASVKNAATDQTQQKTSSSKNLIFQITLLGGTKQFKTFLTTLEKAKRILVLDEFKSQSSDGTLFKFDIFLSAPYAPLPKISKDQVSEPLPLLTTQNEKLLDALNSSEFQDVTQSQITPGPTGVVDPF